MSDVKPEELSALIDGELSAERAAEVREALAGDLELRAELEGLCIIDRNIRRAADDASFDPEIRLLSHPAVDANSWPLSSAGMLLAGLLLARFLPKFAGPAVIGVGLHLLVGTAILWLVMKLLKEPTWSESNSGVRHPA